MEQSGLNDLFTPLHPLGPIAADDVRDREHIRRLFDTKLLIYDEMRQWPSAIVGRRGAGKTALLRSTLLKPDYRIVVELRPHEAFRQIIDSVQEMSKGLILIEEIATIWNLAFMHALFTEMARVARGDAGLAKVRSYIAALGLDDEQTPYMVMKTVLDVLRKHGGERPLSVAAHILDELWKGKVGFSEARDEAIAFLKNKQWRAIILLDSLEDFNLDERTMCHAIAGLLRCQGTFHEAGTPWE